MSARTISPLWRVLGATAPLFEVTSRAHPTMTDGRITSLTTEHGSALAGLSTSTAQVTVTGDLPPSSTSDAHAGIALTSHGAQRLAAITGADPAAITTRFTGRIAAQTVTDHNPAKRRRTTTLALQDWAAYIPQLDSRSTLGTYANQSVANLLRTFWNVPTLSMPYPLSQDGNHHTVRYVGTDPAATIPISEVLSRYAEDLGHLVWQTRAGQPRTTAHSARRAKAPAPHPLQRSQVLDPISWVQPATIPVRLGYQHYLTHDDADGTRQPLIGPPALAKLVHVDLTHVYPLSYGSSSASQRTAFDDAMAARLYREGDPGYRVEEVEVDLPALIRRGTAGDLAQVAQLLTLEHDAAITLGHDWPDHVDGVYYIERIRHTVTAETWRVTLTISPDRHVSGSVRPTPAGLTWDTAYPPATRWDDPTTTWETTP